MTPFTLGNIESVISALLLVVSITLFIISLFAFARHRGSSLALLSASFFLFVAEGVLYAVHIFLFYFSNLEFNTLEETLTLLILVLMFLATYRR